MSSCGLARVRLTNGARLNNSCQDRPESLGRPEGVGWRMPERLLAVGVSDSRRTQAGEEIIVDRGASFSQMRGSRSVSGRSRPLCTYDTHPVHRASMLACALGLDSRRCQTAAPCLVRWHRRRSRCEARAPRQSVRRLGSPSPILHTAGHRQFNRSRGRCHGARSRESASRYTYRQSSSGRPAEECGRPHDTRRPCPGRG